MIEKNEKKKKKRKKDASCECPSEREFHSVSNIFSGMVNKILSYFVSNLVVILMYVNFFAICFLCKQEIQFVAQDFG